MTIPEKLADWRGNAYGPGDFVLVPCTSGSVRWMAEGIVQRFTEQRVIVKITRISNQELSRWGWSVGKENGYTPANVTVLREPF